jgi:hypothetical protein
VLLIADFFPVAIKWAGAVLSLGAGLLALTLPGSASAIEQQVFDDTNTVSALRGQIAKIKTRLLFKNAETDEKLSAEIAVVIGRCMELSKKYELDSIAVESGFYPRPAPEEAKVK